MRTLVIVCAVAVLLGSASPALCSIEGAVAHYQLNGNTSDASAFHNDGIAFGGSFVTDRFGNANRAYGLQNSPDRIKLPGAILNGATDFTFFAWVKLDQISGEQGGAANLLSTYGEGWDNYATLNYRPVDNGYMAGEGFDFILKNENTYAGADSIMTLGQWNSVAWVREGGTSHIYVNGIAKYTGTSPVGALAVPADGLWLGNDQDVLAGGWEARHQWYGAIDDVWFFNRALGDEDILVVHNTPEPGSLLLLAVAGVALIRRQRIRAINRSN